MKSIGPVSDLLRTARVTIHGTPLQLPVLRAKKFQLTLGRTPTMMEIGRRA
jgi:hypothetical protein